MLVGHSNGGYVVRSYFAQFPADVVGAVLVDSSNEHMDEHFVGPDWEPEHVADQKRNGAGCGCGRPCGSSAGCAFFCP